MKEMMEFYTIDDLQAKENRNNNKCASLLGSYQTRIPL